MFSTREVSHARGVLVQRIKD
jgi:hypothetical protein